jgi:predicted ATP-dependent endonuclease of OLD family
MTTNPLYINSLHLVGYKSIRDATISFQAGLNIVIGKNGSGKTNLLDFLDIVISSNIIYYHHLDYDNFLINFSVNEENRRQLKQMTK